MWDFYEPPRPRFYRRPWFLATVAVFVLAVIAVFVRFLLVESEFEKKAARFDLKRLEEMEGGTKTGKFPMRLLLRNRLHRVIQT